MSDYKNLPGVNLKINDGQLGLTQDNTTNSLLIIAPVDAPKHVEVPSSPVLVTTENELKENFGSYFYKGKLNPIAAEWSVAKRGGIRNIYLLGLQGANEKELFVELQDKLYNQVYDMNIEQIVVSGLYADKNIEGVTPQDFGKEKFEDVEGLVAYHTYEGTAVVETLSAEEPAVLVIKVGEREAALSVAGELTAEELIEELNEQSFGAAEETGLPLEISFKMKDKKAVVESSEAVVLEGEAVLGALGLTDVQPELKGTANAAALLGNFSEIYSNDAQSVISYISVAPVLTTNVEEINEKVAGLEKAQFSKHVQVIAGPQVGTVLPTSSRVQWMSGVTQYAVLVNELPVQVAPTNQVLPQAGQLRYNLSLRQLDTLTAKRYVTFRVKNNQITVVDAVTSAPVLSNVDGKKDSDFTRLSTLRIVNYIVSEMRQVLDAFIGQPNEFPIYNAMNTAIKGVIKDATANAIIQDATYSIELGQSLDTAVVNLVVLPQFELRKIELTIGLSTPENFNA